MIGKVCESRRDGKSSFRTLKEYLVDQLRSEDWGAGDQEVLDQDGTVFAHTASGVTLEHNGFDLDTLVQEFESVAAMKPKVEDPIYHFVLSWSEDDNPSDKQMLGSAREAMKRLGFEGHQYLSAIHRDTDSPHVHVAVNRIHPDTFKVVNPYRDHYTLRTLANELEEHYGWVPTRQSGKPAAQQADAHGDLTFEQWCKSKVVPLMTPLVGVERPASWADIHKSLAALDVELIEYGKGLVFRTVSDTGTAVAVKASAVHEGFSKPSLERALGTFEAALKAPKAQSYPGDPETFAVAVKGALSERVARWAGRARSDWASLHRMMSENGLQLTRYGQGLAISPADGHGPRMAASKLHRSLAKGKLEARLGPYQPPEVVPSSAYARDRQVSLRRAPTDASAHLRERYAAYRAEMPTYGKLRQNISRSIREIRRETRQEIKEVYDSMPPSAVRTAYIQELRWQQTRQILGERLRLIQQYNAQHEHALGWRQWIEEQAKLGDANAIEMAASWHANRHHQEAHSRANSVAPAQPGSFIELAQSVEALLGWERRPRRNGRTDFYSQEGELMVTQLRNSVKTHRLDDVTVAATMQLAIDTYGRELRLTGSDEFKQRAIEALIKLEAQGGPRVRLSDEDLQQRLERQRAEEVAQRRSSRRMR